MFCAFMSCYFMLFELYKDTKMIQREAEREVDGISSCV